MMQLITGIGLISLSFVLGGLGGFVLCALLVSGKGDE